MAQIRSSSTQSNDTHKPVSHMVPRIIRSPEVHPMSRITVGLSSRESSASIPTDLNKFTYMIMTKSEHNRKNESIFKTTDRKYQDKNTSIGQVVSRIIYENVKTVGTKSSLMKVAVVLNNQIIDNHQQPISSLTNLSSAVLYILIILLRPNDAEGDDMYVIMLQHLSFFSLSFFSNRFLITSIENYNLCF